MRYRVCARRVYSTYYCGEMDQDRIGFFVTTMLFHEVSGCFASIVPIGEIVFGVSDFVYTGVQTIAQKIDYVFSKKSLSTSDQYRLISEK